VFVLGQPPGQVVGGIEVRKRGSFKLSSLIKLQIRQPLFRKELIVRRIPTIL
jgi:hypothetical protein